LGGSGNSAETSDSVGDSGIGRVSLLIGSEGWVVDIVGASGSIV